MPTQAEIDQRFRAWYQAMELSHAMLLAGLRHKIGPEGDLKQAYREWYRGHRDRKWAEIEAVQLARAVSQPMFDIPNVDSSEKAQG